MLAIQNVESEHDGTEGTIRVTTTQQLVEADIKSYIRFDPAIQFTTEIDESGMTLRSDKFDIEKSYTVTFKEGLRGRIGGDLCFIVPVFRFKACKPERNFCIR